MQYVKKCKNLINNVTSRKGKIIVSGGADTKKQHF